VLSPTLGRWLTNDPLGFDAGDVNLVRYLENNPSNYRDPSGNQIFHPSRGIIINDPLSPPTGLPPGFPWVPPGSIAYPPINPFPGSPWKIVYPDPIILKPGIPGVGGPARGNEIPVNTQTGNYISPGPMGPLPWNPGQAPWLQKPGITPINLSPGIMAPTPGYVVPLPPKVSPSLPIRLWYPNPGYQSGFGGAGGLGASFY